MNLKIGGKTHVILRKHGSTWKSECGNYSCRESELDTYYQRHVAKGVILAPLQHRGKGRTVQVKQWLTRNKQTHKPGRAEREEAVREFLAKYRK